MINKIDGLKMVPLSKAVSAALVDSYSDINKAGIQQMFFHWGARGFKKLNEESIGLGKSKTLIKINKSTGTATLPVDFNYELFVGVIDSRGRKVMLRPRFDLADTKHIDQLECIDSCKKCGQNKGICKDLSITEDTQVVVIDDSPYEQTIIKKLYPNGDYYLETRIPVKNIDNGLVEYTTQKEFVAKLSLKPCGCIDENVDANIDIIKNACPEVYSCYFSPCVEVSQVGSYQIFEDTGLMRVNVPLSYSYIYMEYVGALPKINGAYYIPEISFETIVSWIKYKSLDGKRNITLSEKNRAFQMYSNERKNMEKVLFARSISLSEILQSAMSLPKFDIYIPMDYDNCGGAMFPTEPSSGTSSPTQTITSSGGTSTPPVTNNQQYIPLSIAVIAGAGAGSPIVGGNVYQNDKLKGAIGVDSIIVNNNTELKIKGEFVLDTVAGTITRYQPGTVTPNNWEVGDVLVITTFFKLA